MLLLLLLLLFSTCNLYVSRCCLMQNFNSSIIRVRSVKVFPLASTSGTCNYNYTSSSLRKNITIYDLSFYKSNGRCGSGLYSDNDSYIYSLFLILLLSVASRDSLTPLLWLLLNSSIHICLASYFYTSSYTISVNMYYKVYFFSNDLYVFRSCNLRCKS